jgi:DNA-directed RNA polymerase subunit K/omega
MADKYDNDYEENESENESVNDSDYEDEPAIVKKIPNAKIENEMDDDLEEDEPLDIDEIDDLDDDDDNEDLMEDYGNDTTENRNNISHFDDLDDDELDDNDDDAEDKNYLQKFEDNIKTNIIADWHPELKSFNYDEVDVLSRVVRNEEGIIIDPLHKTLPFITRYETARIIGERAKQINSGAMPVIEVDASIIDGYLIALEEYKQKKIPFIIQRPLPNGGVEFWKFEDLEILS